MNAIRLALEEQGNKAGETSVDYESYDDASASKQGWDAAVEAENARKAAADPSVVAYIGTFNSGAARVSIPITCQAGLAMVSPANTYPGLTKPYERDEPGRYYPGCARNYARVIPADDHQGSAAARWAKELGVKKVFVLHDRQLYGTVLGGSFRGEARNVGIEEVGYASADNAAEFRALATRVAASNADLVYYGGVITNALGTLVRELKQALPSVSFMGPDGILDARLLQQAGPAAVGTYFTTVGLDVADYAGEPKAWADRYKARYGDTPSSFAIYGYEAAKVVLAAIAKAGRRSGDRAVVRDLVMATKDFDGVFGRWSFDGNGDTSLITIAGWKVTRPGTEIGSAVEFQKELR